MPTQKGDFVLIDMTAKVKETDEVFDTTVSEVAKNAKIYNENAVYEPRLVVIGEGWVLKNLDEKLLGLEPGKKDTFEIPPEKAFGARDPNKIKLVSLKKFVDQKVAPAPGMEVEIDGKLATIRSVGAGRVQADFNLPLAGRTLVYDVEVKKILESSEERIHALIHRRIPNVDVKKFELTLDPKKVTINVPEEALFLEGLQLAVRGLAFDIQKFFSDVEIVEFLERFVKKEAKAKDQSKVEGEAKPEKPESQPTDAQKQGT